RWRIFTQSTRLAAAATHLASLHSTNALFDKWKNKFHPDVTRDQEPSKIRFTVREKRAEAKRDLKSILYSGGCSTSRHEIAGGYADQLNKKSRMRPAHHSKRAANKKSKRKHLREDPVDSWDDDPAKAFFAAFGKVGSHWTFRRWEERSEWMGNSERNSRTEYQDKSFSLETFGDRKILGLPTSGHLKMEDVKAAFRSSALKWHPDRHQGSARAAAEEKFKHCVDAYKSLCKGHSSR
ncbi:hypothetical protein C2S51_012060, partial [Perilla frutescens var. frutescens]